MSEFEDFRLIFLRNFEANNGTRCSTALVPKIVGS